MAEAKSSILIVEDDLDVADMLDAYFKVHGYTVRTANTGEEAVQACRVERPELVILDIRLPDIDGYEVARQLRTSQRTLQIPIIFLTEKRSRADRLQGLELGADDYISKPFDIQELRLRVRNALKRSIQGPLTNPVTLIPEGVLVEERLHECLEEDNWAALLVSLKNLECFRETYGFVACDDVLRAVSLMIYNAVRDVGEPNDFIGHLSLTDFIVITVPSALAGLQERVTSRLEGSLDYFYPVDDRERGDFQRVRLRVQVNLFSYQQGPFSGVESLKSALLRELNQNLSR